MGAIVIGAGRTTVIWRTMKRAWRSMVAIGAQPLHHCDREAGRAQRSAGGSRRALDEDTRVAPRLGGRMDGPAGGIQLSVEGVAKHFGGVRAVDDGSMDVRKGGILSVIGHTGAGKTTLLH